MKKMEFNQWVSEIKRATEIAEDIINVFNKVDERTKKGISMFIFATKKEIDELVEDGNPTKKEIKNIEKQFFSFWKGAIFIENENFWSRLKREGLSFDRGETRLQELFRKKRFNSIENWIQLFNSYNDLKEAGYIDEQITQEQQNGIKVLMSDKLINCQKMLEKVLNKGRVGKAEYIKFLNAYTILKESKALDERFDQSEIIKLKGFIK